MERQGGFASSISIWEIGIKIKRGYLELPLSLGEFVRRLETNSALEVMPVDTACWSRSVGLDWEHNDPADRVIVATALQKGVPLLTKDRVIRTFAGIRTIW